MSHATFRVTKRGAIVLPKALRDRYGIAVGDTLQLIELPGALMVIPGSGHVEALADCLKEQLTARGETLESLLVSLREQREGDQG